MRNRLKGLDLIDRLPEELWTEVYDTVQETGSIKFGKPSSGHRTGKSQFSFKSQRKAMPKNAQTTTIALISHTSQVVLRFLQVDFNST